VRFLEVNRTPTGRRAAGALLVPTGPNDIVAEIPGWRRRVMRQLDVTLIVFEFVLSVIFFAVSLGTGNPYFRGVGIGLVIAWVTSTVAVLYRRMAVTVP
jgi:hypothetical protein